MSLSASLFAICFFSIHSFFRSKSKPELPSIGFSGLFVGVFYSGVVVYVGEKFNNTKRSIIRRMSALVSGSIMLWEPLKTGVKSKNGQGVPASRKADEDGAHCTFSLT